MAILIDDGRLIADSVVDCDSMLAIRHTEYYVVGNIHENRAEDFVFKIDPQKIVCKKSVNCGKIEISTV